MFRACGEQTWQTEVDCLNAVEDNKLAAPCGLYCGACIDYLVYGNCHGCGCECGTCAASEHHKTCDVYKCCVEQRGFKGCNECGELPCSRLVQFCCNPVWLHHSPVVESLRRRKAIGTRKWLKEQKKVWSNEWYLQKWLWFQKECENRLKQSLEESKSLFSGKK